MEGPLLPQGKQHEAQRQLIHFSWEVRIVSGLVLAQLLVQNLALPGACDVAAAILALIILRPWEDQDE